MTSSQIECFLAAAECKSFTKKDFKDDTLILPSEASSIYSEKRIRSTWLEAGAE